MLKCGEPTELISLVVTAVQRMNEVSVGKETRVIKYNQEKGKKMKETVSSVVTLEEWFASQKHLLEHHYVFVVRGLSNSLSLAAHAQQGIL